MKRIDKMLSTRIAAQRLGVSPQTLKNWRSQKKTGLPWHVIGTRTVRYYESDVMEYQKSTARYQKTQ